MRSGKFCFVLFLLLALAAWSAEPKWQARLSYIEACSCHLFCPCFYYDHAAHKDSGQRQCMFNNVVRVDYGKYGDVNLTGLKVWLAGNLGPDWGTKGQADWLVATFEPSATQQQKDAMMAIFAQLYPVKWKSAQFDTSAITWKISPDGRTAEAKLENGKGEVKLMRAGTDPTKPAQVNNTRYFAATWNSPFNLYFSDHYYKGFGKEFAPKHANGFTITVEISSDGKRVVGGATKKSAAD